MNDDASNNRSFIDRLNETIARHLSEEKFGVEELARKLGVSKTQLHRKLQLHTGKSASQLIREARLEKGRELLESGKFTVSEVAYQVGFNSPTYFNTCFHEFYGFTPGEIKIRQSLQGARKNGSTSRYIWLLMSIFVLIFITYAIFKFLPDYFKGSSSAENENDLIEYTNPVPDKSIAVIPFNISSKDNDQDYLGKGMVYAIRDHLYKVGGLHVISDLPPINFENDDLSTQEIGRLLGVGHVLSGFILIAGDIIQITPQLTDAKSNEVIWSDTYEGNLSNVSGIIAIQTDVAKQVALGCKVAISDKIEGLIRSESITQNQLAHKYYQKGVDYWNSKHDHVLALEMLTKAIGEDPSFAAAYTRRAIMHAQAYHFKKSDNWLSHDQMALEDIKKAEQLAPGSIEVKLAQAVYYFYTARNYEQALSILNQLKEDLPNMAELYAYSAFIKRRQGKWSESIGELERAMHMEPFNVVFIAELSATYERIREFDTSIEIAREGLEKVPDFIGFRMRIFVAMRKKTGNLSMATEASGLQEEDMSERYYMYSSQFDKAIEYVQKEGETLANPNNFHPKTHNIAHYYFYKGDTTKSRIYADSAIHLLEKKLKENPQDHRLASPLSKCYAFKGEKEKAIKYAKMAIDMLPKEKDALLGIGKETELAKTYVFLGEYDLALDQIEYLLSVPGYLTYGDLWIRPEYFPLRSHPRFQKIISQGEDLRISS